MPLNRPYLTELIDLLIEANSLPVKLPVNIIQMKIELVNEWIVRVNELFNSGKVYKTSTDSCIDTSFLLEALTPRLEINHILSKLSQSNSLSISVESSKSSKKSKQSKSVAITSNSDPQEQEQQQMPIDIYRGEKEDFHKLREYLKQIELKEALLIKKLRNFNEERINAWRQKLVSLLNTFKATL